MNTRAARTLNLHAVIERSRANGPGERMVIWTQGCDLGCPGCFNPQTHPFEEHLVVTVDALASRIAGQAARLDGLTVSGGEPFAQPEPLAELLAAVRARTALSILVFSGYTLAQIRRDERRARALRYVDVLIAGRYAARRRAGTALLGSANQAIHLLSARHRMEEIRATPECEIHIGSDGTTTVTGIGAPGLA